MSGLLALLDDVAAIVKLAATQIDDIAAKATKTGAKVAGSVIDDAAKAGAKSAGVVIDDAAVTPKYVHGLPAAREIPIVAQIARASLFNKLCILLPIAMLLDAFAPWMLIPLLILGGAYLCFEGAEKIVHVILPGSHTKEEAASADPEHLERTRVAGAIKTDFILSAEIMTIAMSEIEADSLWVTGVVLAVVAIGITALVYGSVMILVKADDVGLKLSQVGRFEFTRALGRGIVKAMPGLMTLISTIGTAAMLWVGGSIIIHELKVMGLSAPAHFVEAIANQVAQAVSFAVGLVHWVVKASLDGLFGLLIGIVLVPFIQFVAMPVIGKFKGTG